MTATPSGRLAVSGHCNDRGEGAIVRLAIGGPELACMNGLQRQEQENRPAILASYLYLKQWLCIRDRAFFRDWVLDSGAFSANSMGIKIDLRAYIETCKELLACDPQLTEVFALDVIGDPESSRRNAEAMRDAGLDAIPCYHVGDPKELLTYYAQNWSKVALGGAVGYKRKLKFARQCFRQVWPHKVHGFGYGSKDDILALPWHSVDATTWEIGPTKFGRWNGYGNAKTQKLSVLGNDQKLEVEVDYYLRVERMGRAKWARRYKELEAVTP